MTSEEKIKELEESVRKWKNDFEEERTELMEILQSMDIGVMIVDYTGKLFFANLAATHMIPTTKDSNMIDQFAESFTQVPIREYIARVLKSESITVKEIDALGKIFSLSGIVWESWRFLDIWRRFQQVKRFVMF